MFDTYVPKLLVNYILSRILQVWECLVDVVGWEEGPPLWIPDNHLVLRLPRGVQHLQLQTRQVEGELVPEGDGGLDQAGHVLTLIQPGNR